MATPESPKAHLLLVDDEAQMLSGLAEFLLQEGYKVDTAQSGRLATECLDRESYDLVVTDIRMPDMSGVELLEHINAHGSKVETILITGYASQETAVEALRLGAYDYLEKPFDMVDLFKTIGNCLEKIHLKRSNAELLEKLEAQNKDLERRVSEKTAQVLEREKRLARIEVMKEILATVAIYINNANGVIYGFADFCHQNKDPKSRLMNRLIETCLQEGQKITAVIDSLDKVIRDVDMKSVSFIRGSEVKIIDIEKQLAQRLQEMADEEEQAGQ